MYFIFCISIFLIHASQSSSDKLAEKLSSIEWLCSNENCSEPISIATARQPYVRDDSLKISFKRGDIINIYGESTDSKERFWLVSDGNKFGVVSKDLVREDKIVVPRKECILAKYDFKNHFIHGQSEPAIGSHIKPSPKTSVVDSTTLLADYADDGVYVTTDDSSEKEDNIKSLNEPNTPDELKSSGINENLDDFDTTGNTVNFSAVNDSLSSSITGGTANDSAAYDSLNSSDLHKFEDESQQNFTDVDSNETESANQKSILESNSADRTNNNTPETLFKTSENENKDSKSDETDHLGEKQTIIEPVIPHNIDNQNSSSQNKVPEPTIQSNESLQFSENLTEAPTPNNEGDAVEYVQKPINSETTNDRTSIGENDFVQQNNSRTKDTAALPDVVSETTVEPSEQVDKIISTNTENTAGLPSILSQPQEQKLEYSTNIPEFKIGQDPVYETSNFLMSNEEGLRISEQNHTSQPQQATESTTSPPPETSNTSEAPATETNTDSLSGTYKFDDKIEGNTESESQKPALKIPIESEGISPPTSDKSALPNVEMETSSVSPPVSDSIDVTQKLNISPNFDYTSSQTVLNSYETDNVHSKEILSDTSYGDLDKVASATKPKEEIKSSPDITTNESQNKENEGKTNVEANHISQPASFAEAVPSSVDLKEESFTNWFSPVSSMMNSIRDMFVNSDIGVDDAKVVEELSEKKTVATSMFHDENQSSDSGKIDVCEKDNFCEQPDASHKDIPISPNKDVYSESVTGIEESISSSTVVCLIITSVAVLLFSLGYYYIENLRHDTELAARINSLSAELFFAQKELSTTEDLLAQANDSLLKMKSNSSISEEELNNLKQRLEESEMAKHDLELEVKRLEKEIESLVESSNEMHRMLAESITEDERSQALLANIDDLKSVISSKLDEISSLTDQLDKEKQEVELLTIALKKSEEKKENLEEKLEKIVNEIDTNTLSVTKEFEEKIISLERIIEENSLQRLNFEKEIQELKQKCEGLFVEKELAEKSLKKAHGLTPGKALTDWLETKEVRIQLSAAQKEVEKLKTELQETKDTMSNLKDKQAELLSEIETLNNNYETAERDKIEALTKLQVLSNYFKEKEIQLKEELGEKEAQWLQKQSEDHTIYEQMRSLREENLSYKAQNEALKREILDQEASFKIQIANEEQKAQEHWVQLRHTERRLKEAQMEASHLRSRLTALETSSDPLDEKHNKSLEMVNGEVGMGAASPPFMLYPPPDFIPPPPLVSPSRPPPLGRLSSPPLTPPPPLSPFDIFPPNGTPPPPPPLRVHKPHPREPPHKQKDSQSSNHSSESLEKPVRRGKR